MATEKLTMQLAFAQKECEQARAQREARRQLMNQFANTGSASETDKQWFRETFLEELEKAVSNAVLSAHNDTIKDEFSRFTVFSIATAPKCLAGFDGFAADASPVVGVDTALRRK